MQRAGRGAREGVGRVSSMAATTLTTPKPALEPLRENAEPRLGGPGSGNGSG